MTKETDLYAPIKALFEEQGYEVKSEIGALDVMAIHPAAPDDPVVVELKTTFALALFHQAIARQKLTDWVYVAVPRKPGKAFQSGLKSNLALCRRLGIGLITVRLKDGHTEIHADPGPYAPRKSKSLKARLLREFAKRQGDPNSGGATRTGLVTAYRQDAMKLRDHLAEHGACKGADVARATGVTRATTIMRDDHYGWFEKVSLGVYDLRAQAAAPEKT
ncbi:MAG: DUF2161 domain-containing phosphodiesterase [Pseudomonadota bacterium]